MREIGGNDDEEEADEEDEAEAIEDVEEADCKWIERDSTSIDADTLVSLLLVHVGVRLLDLLHCQCPSLSSLLASALHSVL